MDFIWFRLELTSNRQKLESEKKRKGSGESACWSESSAGATALEPHPLFLDDFQVDWKMKNEEKRGMFGKCKETPTLIGC